MSAPPGGTPAQGITGTRTKAEIRRELADRFNAAARRTGVTLLGWQVRSLICTALAQQDEPTDEQLMLALMRAPWFPKPHRRRYKVGEVGWRVST